MTIGTLQKIINKRAEEKLEKDLRFLTHLYQIDNYKYHKILEDVYVDIGTNEKSDKVPAHAVFKKTGRLYREAFDKNINRYIEEETKLFIKEIEDLKNRTENLESDVQNALNYL